MPHTEITHSPNVVDFDRTLTQAEYDHKREHAYAGPGRPSDPNAPGIWWLELDERYGTVLVLGDLVEECGFCDEGRAVIRSLFGLGGKREVECPYCDGTGKQLPLNHPHP